MSGIDAPTASATAVLLGLLLLTAAAAPAVAATDTPVRLAGADEPTPVGETTEIPVVVGEAEGGVGAYDLTVAVEDPDVATVVAVEVAGDPGLRDVEIAPDGSNASVRAALMDTDDRGEVTIATVTVAGESAGSTDAVVSVETLGDEEGRAYTVTAEEGASVAVTDGSSDGADSTDGSSDGADSADDSSDETPGETTDGTDSDDTDSDTSGDDTDSDTSGDDTESDTSGDDTGSGTSQLDADADTADGGWVPSIALDGFGSLSARATAAFVLFAGVALIGGAAYLRRLR